MTDPTPGKIAHPPFEVWGLTGGIASGKSTAARMLEEEGFPVLDADLIAYELSSPGGAAHAQILRRFGTDDRARLREIIFRDSAARRDLESILHPLIEQESLLRMNALSASRPAGAPKLRIIYEAALLVETGRYRHLTGLIVIDSSWAHRRQRLIDRDGASSDLAKSILASQIPDQERLKVATHAIRNDGTIEELREKVKALIRKLGWKGP